MELRRLHECVSAELLPDRAVLGDQRIVRDLRAAYGREVYAAGSGLVRNGNQFAVNSAVVPTFLTASSTIDFGPIATATCADDPIPLTGAAVGDAVAPGWPAALETGLSGMMLVSAADTVTVRLCNLTASAIDPAGASFRATIVRSF
jgi:hypothetical protein